MKKILQPVIIFIISYLTTVSIAGVTGFGITGIEIMLPSVFALAAIVYYQAIKRILFLKNDAGKAIRLKGDILCSLPVAVIFSASAVIGAHFDIWEEIITDLGPKDALYFLVLTVFFASVIIILFSWIDGLASGKEPNAADATNNESKENEVSARQSISSGDAFLRKRYWLTVVIMMICWMPYFLTMCPGNLGKDTFESIDMCLGNIPWTNHHPIFFTALINVVLKLTSFADSVTFSMAVFTLLHMFAVACTLGYITVWIKKYNLITLLFFAINPVVAMYSIYISKDVLFSCALVLLVLKLIDCEGDFDSIKDCIWLGIWALLTMLLRNNGLMIVALMAGIMLIAYRRQWKKLLIATAAPILIFLLFRTCAYNALSIEPESFAESASVPLQQIGYVISESQGRCFDGCDGDCDIATGSKASIRGLSESDIQFLQELMPFKRVAEVYNIGYVDSYKFDEQFNDELLNDNVGRFMGIWFKALPGNLNAYVKAYLAEMGGYWHYGETNTLCTQGVWEDNALGVVRVDVIRNISGVSLYVLIEKLMLIMRKAPLLCILSSMAMQFYGLLLLICVKIRKRQEGNYIVAILPLLLLWVSIMIASPAFCLFRYTYPLFLMWPVMITGIVLGGEK